MQNEPIVAQPRRVALAAASWFAEVLATSSRSGVLRRLGQLVRRRESGENERARARECMRGAYAFLFACDCTNAIQDCSASVAPGAGGASGGGAGAVAATAAAGTDCGGWKKSRRVGRFESLRMLERASNSLAPSALLRRRRERMSDRRSMARSLPLSNAAQLAARRRRRWR